MVVLLEIVRMKEVKYIRYVLFIMDKYAGAQNLIDELKLVHPKRSKSKKKKKGRERLRNDGGLAE